MHRVVLIGASNLTLSLPLLLSSLREAAKGSLDVLAAQGHGRSYGQWSRFFLRSLPGIRGCGLWQALAARAPTVDQPWAVVTDIGNDLGYGASAERTVAWVRSCIERLAAVEARIVLTALPVASLGRLTPASFLALRSLFFPGSGVRLEAIRSAIPVLDGTIRDLAQEFGATLVTPRLEWYGPDPVHMRPGRRRLAWSTVLAGWPEWSEAVRRVETGASDSLRIWARRPAKQRRLGLVEAASQPCLRDGGLELSLF